MDVHFKHTASLSHGKIKRNQPKCQRILDLHQSGSFLDIFSTYFKVPHSSLVILSDLKIKGKASSYLMSDGEGEKNVFL